MHINNQSLKIAGLKVTYPRLKILKILKRIKKHHISAEYLYKKLTNLGEDIGLATVYRVLNNFDKAGIVTKHNFESGKSTFELIKKKNHDHLICLDCGKIMEFYDKYMNKYQKNIAKKYGIKLSNHSIYLYGNCEKKNYCKKKIK
ncbi:MAG: ferric iron uptake transcriptional regulator [Arsenophonus sp.]|nr:MAG: ferric iron uptake transcriptional regulator [Arsenophonus sp.]